MTEPEVRQAVAERVTVGFIPKVVGELGYLVRSTGMSKTDLVNRAVSLYTFVSASLAGGDELLIRNGRTGELERVHLL